MAKDPKPNRPTHTRRLWLIPVVVIGLSALSLTGCEEEEIGAYQTAKSPPYAPPAPIDAAQSHAGHDHGQAHQETIRWDVPDGWQADPAPSAMVTAVFNISDEAGDLRVSVTKLAGDGGGTLANINRWRGQVGLGTVAAIQDQPITSIKTDQFTADLVDLVSPPGAAGRFERMLVVSIPRQETGQTWFIKMTGPGGAIDKHKQDFVGFVGSISFEGGHP